MGRRPVLSPRCIPLVLRDLSIFPLLLLCVTAVGFVVGDHAGVRDQILDYVSRSGAPEARPLLDETLTSLTMHTTARGVGAAVGVITLLFGASAVFSELESALNVIWRVRGPKAKSIWQTVLYGVKDKALSFLLVLGVAAAVLVSLVISTALSAIDGVASKVIRTPALWLLAETAVSIALLTGLFTVMYEAIPRTKIAWRDVIGGAFLAALLFSGLKRVFAWYLGHIGSYAAYGAVGGILGLLAWIYLASLILFLGAEFARVYAERFGTLAAATKPLSGALEHDRRSIDRRPDHPGPGTNPHSISRQKASARRDATRDALTRS
jgi:membrane protein